MSETPFSTDFRTVPSVRGRGFRWSLAEDCWLREHYPQEGNSDELQQKLGRTEHAIECRVHRLKLQYIAIGHKRKWTPNELETLKRRYSTEGASVALCKTLRRTKVSVTQQARLSGLFVSKTDLVLIRRKSTPVGKHSPVFSGCEDISGQFISALRQDARKRDIFHPLLDGSTTNNRYLWDLYLTQGHRCALSGVEIKFRSNSYSDGRYALGTASLDRIDSSEGYIVGNVQWVHKHVNVMKRSISQEEFIQLANQIAKRHPRI